MHHLPLALAIVFGSQFYGVQPRIVSLWRSAPVAKRLLISLVTCVSSANFPARFACAILPTQLRTLSLRFANVHFW